MALGEHTARAFCPGAFAHISPPSAFQCLLYLHRAFRHTSHHWRALYLCKDASGPLGKAFFRIFAKPFRPGRSLCIRIFFWHSRFANCCSASVEFSARGALGCRPRSSWRSAVFLKFWKASSRKQSRPEKESSGLVGKATSGTRKTTCSRRYSGHLS